MQVSKGFKYLLVSLAVLAGQPCLGQTTDGYHSIQIFPVVVDTASFTQRFSFRNPNPVPLTITPRYFPASGTTAVKLTCPDVIVAAGSSLSFTSLRDLCPALAAGSQFGFLYTSESNDEISPYAAFSRVANPQGNGFAVEAFSANEFTSATVVVNGVRRMAASGAAPAFQTNCFVGNLNEAVPQGAPPLTLIHYSIYTLSGTLIASADLSLLPGEIVRLLDVFAIAPPGDYPDAYVTFEEQGAEEPGIMALCTVQDNTSFGADLRIAKQELGAAGNLFGPGSVVGPQDSTAIRNFNHANDGRNFFTLSPSGHYNEHLFYFRHPDYVACEILDTTGNQVAANVEMRLTDYLGNVVAGGSDIAGFGRVYLGEKTDRYGGSNGRYILRVEGTEQLASEVSYVVHCVSGSGHTRGDILVKDGIGDAF